MKRADRENEIFETLQELQRGWDVRTATEEDRLGETDKEQLRFARS